MILCIAEMRVQHQTIDMNSCRMLFRSHRIKQETSWKHNRTQFLFSKINFGMKFETKIPDNFLMTLIYS